MLLWRLSGEPHAASFDGCYGMLFHGRWNTVGHAVTYAATSPSLCVLERLVHIEDPALMPRFMLVRYDVPDDLLVERVMLADLPDDWRRREATTQERGDTWHDTRASVALFVPSAIVPVDGAPDVNVVINHRHPAVARIRIVAIDPFELDVRLL